MWKCPKCGREFSRQNQDHYYYNQTYKMYSGPEHEITLICDNSLIGKVIDRFGKKAPKAANKPVPTEYDASALQGFHGLEYGKRSKGDSTSRPSMSWWTARRTQRRRNQPPDPCERNGSLRNDRGLPGFLHANFYSNQKINITGL